ncbi:hypothetical protein LZ31DRAFT_169883 [Colletotrichum somersetense]|nr:hypothetical protein LZ31DRAFT_169883 [Colletotrichum somersetense]
MLPRKPNQKNEEEKRKRKREKKSLPTAEPNPPTIQRHASNTRNRPRKPKRRADPSTGRVSTHRLLPVTIAVAQACTTIPAPGSRSWFRRYNTCCNWSLSHIHSMRLLVRAHCLLALRDTAHSMCLTIPIIAVTGLLPPTRSDRLFKERSGHFRLLPFADNAGSCFG